jgi:hypothetical protein
LMQTNVIIFFFEILHVDHSQTSLSFIVSITLNVTLKLII